MHEPALADIDADMAYVSPLRVEKHDIAGFERLARHAGSVDAAKPELDCARLFLADRYRQVRRSIRRISRNQDDRMKAVAERVLETADAAPIGPTDHV